MSLPGSSLLWLLQRGVPDLMFAYQLLLIPHIIWQCFLTFEVLRIEKKAFDRYPSYEPWDVGTNSVYSPMVPVCIYYIPCHWNWTYVDHLCCFLWWRTEEKGPTFTKSSSMKPKLHFMAMVIAIFQFSVEGRPNCIQRLFPTRSKRWFVVLYCW